MKKLPIVATGSEALATLGATKSTTIVFDLGLEWGERPVVSVNFKNGAASGTNTVHFYSGEKPGVGQHDPMLKCPVAYSITVGSASMSNIANANGVVNLMIKPMARYLHCVVNNAHATAAFSAADMVACSHPC